MDYVDMDQYIVEQDGMTISEMFARYGEAYFSDREHEAVIALAAREDTIISSGGGALTFRRNAEALRGKAKIVYIDTAFEICCERIYRNPDRPLVKANTRESLKALYDRRDSLYRACADGIITNNTTPEESADMLCALIGK
jgi:shikimate kinase